MSAARSSLAVVPDVSCEIVGVSGSVQYQECVLSSEILVQGDLAPSK